MEKFTTEGVIINAIPFRNYDCILTVFTPLEGLVKFFCRGAYSSKKRYGSGITTPLSLVEIIYTKGRGDLYACVEISVIDHNLALRATLPVLEAACKILHSLAATQQPGKAAPELYQLFLAYLHKLPHAPIPQTITSSFQLKILRYEGLLTLLSHCCACSEILEDTWIYENEAFCNFHTPEKSFFLTQEERSIVEHLAFCLDFTKIVEITVPSHLSQKICHLFDSCFEFI